MHVTPQAPVAIAVVSYNTRAHLAECLDSLAPEVSAERAKVWVVDNGSSDGSPDMVRERAPWAELVAGKTNPGFGAAVNLVARRSQSAWIAAANADIALQPGALEIMLAAGEEAARIGAVAPRLLLRSGATQHSVYAFPTLAVALAFNTGVHRLLPALGERLCLHGSWDPDRRREVDWAIGAFLLVRRTAFETAGGFDGSQWMYAEDLDLGWRMRHAGYVTLYEPSAVVRHAESAATSAAFGEARTARLMAATYRTIWRRRGLPATWAIAAVNWAGAAARVAAYSGLARLSGRWRGRRDESRTWLRAHRQGLASRKTLAGY